MCTPVNLLVKRIKNNSLVLQIQMNIITFNSQYIVNCKFNQNNHNIMTFS